jgi:two-component sensor histidine kinase
MPGNDGPVLILATTGRDASVAMSILNEIDIGTHVCAGLDELIDGLDKSCCAIVTEETLRQTDRQRLAKWVESQPPWSDFPFVLLAMRGYPPDQRLTNLLGNVSILERPFHPSTLVSATRSAVRARKRQREAEAYLEERQRTAERQSLLIRELHHRVKNTLATVQALLGATKRSSSSMDEFYESFAARIVSLARTQTLLTEDYWQTASLREILESELEPYGDGNGERIRLEGPDAVVTADLAVPTGMAIHELTTNALKYGSLSVPTGRIRVEWDIRGEGQEKVLFFEWRESHGPNVSPPERTGFGTMLLERVLATQCDARIENIFDPAGLIFRMEAPLRAERLVPPY